MQPSKVKAFRLRLQRAGFTAISIYEANTYGKWWVLCTDPSGKKIHKEMTVQEMEVIPRLVWFD